MTLDFEPKLVDYAKLWAQRGGLEASEFGVLDPGYAATQVFGNELDSARFFLYLFRRFGLPLGKHYNARKEACNYCFTTPHPDVYLRVSIRAYAEAGGLFGYATTPELGNAVREETQKFIEAWHEEKAKWAAAGKVPEKDATTRFRKAFPQKWQALSDIGGPLRQECRQAFLAVFIDFLRPTSIGDTYFNAVGEIDSRRLRWNGDDDDSGDDEEVSYKGRPVAEYADSYFPIVDTKVKPRVRRTKTRACPVCQAICKEID
jgi:hypothetical protein